MTVTKNKLVAQLLSNLKLKDKSALATALGTSPSTITDLTQGRTGRTVVNSCILVKELAGALTPEKRTAAILRASEQYRKRGQ